MILILWYPTEKSYYSQIKKHIKGIILSGGPSSVYDDHAPKISQEILNFNVPVLGIVENMSWFTPEELPENKYYIFGQEGCRRLAEKTGIDLLGEIPIIQGIRESGDAGKPVALEPGKMSGKAFHDLAVSVIRAVEKRNAEQQPSKKVEITT